MFIKNLLNILIWSCWALTLFSKEFQFYFPNIHLYYTCAHLKQENNFRLRHVMCAGSMKLPKIQPCRTLHSTFILHTTHHKTTMTTVRHIWATTPHILNKTLPRIRQIYTIPKLLSAVTLYVFCCVLPASGDYSQSRSHVNCAFWIMFYKVYDRRIVCEGMYSSKYIF